MTKQKRERKEEKFIEKKVPVAFTPPVGKISHLHLYYQAFRTIDKQFGMTIILDIAYLLTIFGLLLLFFALLKAVLLPVATALLSILGLFTVIDPTAQMTGAAETTILQNLSAIKWFYVKATALLIATIFTFFGVTSLYKAFIWLHITKQKQTVQYLKKFVGMNMLWQALWLITAIIIFLGFTVKAAALTLTLELFAYMYFTPFFRSQLTEKHSLKQAYKETIVLGAKKFKHFAIPICLMFITVVFAWMLGVMLITIVAPFALLLFAMAFIVLATAWIRFYFYVITKKVLDTK